MTAECLLGCPTQFTDEIFRRTSVGVALSGERGKLGRREQIGPLLEEDTLVKVAWGQRLLIQFVQLAVVVIYKIRRQKVSLVTRVFDHTPFDQFLEEALELCGNTHVDLHVPDLEQLQHPLLDGQRQLLE